MNWDHIEGSWNLYKAKVKDRWGKLTYVDLQVIAGSRHRLIDKIQNAYGVTRDEAEHQLDCWEVRGKQVFHATSNRRH